MSGSQAVNSNKSSAQDLRIYKFGQEGSGLHSVPVVAKQVPLALGNPRRRRLGMGIFRNREDEG